MHTYTRLISEINAMDDVVCTYKKHKKKKNDLFGKDCAVDVDILECMAMALHKLRVISKTTPFPTFLSYF
jgi:hypothetical protein